MIPVEKVPTRKSTNQSKVTAFLLTALLVFSVCLSACSPVSSSKEQSTGVEQEAVSPQKEAPSDVPLVTDESEDAAALEATAEAEQAAEDAAKKEAAKKAKAEKKVAEKKAKAKKAKAEKAKAAKKAKIAQEKAEAKRKRAAAAKSQKNETTVYITRTGAKYHRGSCHHLRQSKIKTTKSEAVSSGYGACKNCRP